MKFAIIFSVVSSFPKISPNCSNNSTGPTLPYSIYIVGAITSYLSINYLSDIMINVGSSSATTSKSEPVFVTLDSLSSGQSYCG